MWFSYFSGQIDTIEGVRKPIDIFREVCTLNAHMLVRTEYLLEFLA
jgi:hypothetical protein